MNRLFTYNNWFDHCLWRTDPHGHSRLRGTGFVRSMHGDKTVLSSQNISRHSCFIHKTLSQFCQTCQDGSWNCRIEEIIFCTNKNSFNVFKQLLHIAMLSGGVLVSLNHSWRWFYPIDTLYCTSHILTKYISSTSPVKDANKYRFYAKNDRFFVQEMIGTFSVKEKVPVGLTWSWFPRYIRTIQLF